VIGVTRTDTALTGLESTLDYRFGDQALLERALTHLSAVKPADARHLSNQRLEFLGDRVLGLAVTAMLYRAFPFAEEGELSRRLAELVRRETCAAVAHDWALGPRLMLGPGEAQSGGRGKDAILADACEAVIGAVFLDGGFEAAAAMVERFWRPRMLAPNRPLRDAKTRLQEWAQGQGLPTPVYRETARSGPDHAPVFVIAAEVDGLAPQEGRGASKRLGEQDAARNFLAREGIAHD
jgi:ribonuclease-3